MPIIPRCLTRRFWNRFPFSARQNLFMDFFIASRQSANIGKLHDVTLSWSNPVWASLSGCSSVVSFLTMLTKSSMLASFAPSSCALARTPPVSDWLEATLFVFPFTEPWRWAAGFTASSVRRYLLNPEPMTHNPTQMADPGIGLILQGFVAETDHADAKLCPGFLLFVFRLEWVCVGSNLRCQVLYKFETDLGGVMKTRRWETNEPTNQLLKVTYGHNGGSGHGPLGFQLPNLPRGCTTSSSGDVRWRPSRRSQFTLTTRFGLPSLIQLTINGCRSDDTATKVVIHQRPIGPWSPWSPLFSMVQTGWTLAIVMWRHGVCYDQTTACTSPTTKHRSGSTPLY